MTKTKWLRLRWHSLRFYWCGYRNARAGRDVSLTIRVGAICNGLASIILIAFGLCGQWRS